MSPSVREAAVPNAVRLDEKDRILDAPVAGFTAVNGRSPPQSLKLSGNGSERRHSRPELTPENDRVLDRRTPSQHPDPPPTPWPPERDARPLSPAKRKRSLCDDEEDDETADMYSRVAPRSSSSVSSEEDEEDDENGDVLARERDFAATSQRHVSASAAGAEGDRVWYDGRADVVGPNNQYADALRRESEPIDASRKGSLADGSRSVQSSNDYDAKAEYTRAGVQVDKKKRKRQFSNRTKTGCQTCRRRKKKCDETKPHCNNCIRGGFMCEGYFIRSTWTKPGLHKSHIPLQSKDGYPEHSGIYPRPTAGACPDPRLPQPFDGAQPRPVVTGDERASARSSNPWPSWQPSPSRVGNDFSRTALPLEALRTHQSYSDQNSYPHRQSGPPVMAPSTHQPQYPSTPQPQYPSTPQPAMTAQRALQQQQQQHQQHQQHPQQQPHQQQQQNQNQNQNQAQPQPQPQPLIPQRMAKMPSEKDKMLTGKPFLPSSPQLLAQRDQCKRALLKFNSISMDVSREERMRLFQVILEPQHTPYVEAGLKPVGQIGKGSLVEAPFHCDYGFNIVIGEDVMIDAGCTIGDAQRVTIGSGCILGHNVRIYTSEYLRNPQDRRGTKGMASAMAVHIEENVHIGDDVVILPGAHIGKDSFVEPGSVVKAKILGKI